jgi:hypothetical protein
LSSVACEAPSSRFSIPKSAIVTKSVTKVRRKPSRMIGE